MKNSILFSSVDREDYWVSGICIKVNTSGSYEEMYESVKNILESEKVVKYVIKDNCLREGLFKNDATFKFKRTYWAYALVYEFENEEGETVEFRFEQTDNILSL